MTLYPPRCKLHCLAPGPAPCPSRPPERAALINQSRLLIGRPVSSSPQPQAPHWSAPLLNEAPQKRAGEGCVWSRRDHSNNTNAGPALRWLRCADTPVIRRPRGRLALSRSLVSEGE